MRPLPKSLHTISVLENLARFLLIRARLNDAETAINLALEILKLDDLPDPYGLAELALAKLNEGSA